MMLDLIKFIVEQFASSPETIEYITEEDGDEIKVTIVLEESDMGKVIGRQGRIAKALRTIVKAASVKEGKKYAIEIRSKEENGVKEQVE